jgi:hypothetical protein
MILISAEMWLDSDSKANPDIYPAFTAGFGKSQLIMKYDRTLSLPLLLRLKSAVTFNPVLHVS